MADDRRTPENWAQARARIDRGESGDKIAHEDPATTPLGTDAEAGGAATAREDIARSARSQDSGAAARGMAQAPRAGGRRLVPWLVAGLAIALGATLALLVASGP